MRPELLVIGIEKLLEGRIKAFVAGNVLAQNESFEKPSGMREMPLGWARIRHGLQHLVFSRKWLRESQRGCPDFAVSLTKRTIGQLLGVAGVHRGLQSGAQSIPTESRIPAWMQDQQRLLHFLRKIGEEKTPLSATGHLRS